MEYQERHIARGLCVNCASRVLPGSRHCLRHFLFRRLVSAGVRPPVVNHRENKKRENLAAHLQGRYSAIRSGHLRLTEVEQVEKDVVQMRERLKIAWGGVRGVRKMARVIHSLDRRAYQEKVIIDLRKEA